MSPKFVKTSVRKSETLGERLSKKRVSLGFEVKDVERTIRIRAKHVELIEASDWDKLPPDVYVRGFLRSYARFLKLDPDKVITIYLKEKGLTENVKRIATKTEIVKKKAPAPRVIITPKRLIFFSTGFLAITVLAYIAWQIVILTAPPRLSLVTPADNIKVEDDAIIVEGRTDAGSNVFVNDVPIGVTPDGFFKESVSLQDGVNLVKISAKNRMEKETEITRTIVAELPDIPVAGATSQLSMKITIGMKPVSLQIKLDGRALSAEALMQAGTSQIVNANTSISISASDAGNVRIVLNGKDLGPLGEVGRRVTDREFTLENL